MKERDLLAPLRAVAHAVLDTTHQNVHELRREVIARYGGKARRNGLEPIVRVQSFGFKFGPPNDADLVFDIRFLPNPYFEEDLRPLSGLDAPVAEFVIGQPDAEEFLRYLLPLLLFCIPKYQSEGKSYITIAIGCTGGRHRSVAMTNEVTRRLRNSGILEVSSTHRDVSRTEHSDRDGVEHSPLLKKN